MNKQFTPRLALAISFLIASLHAQTSPAIKNAERNSVPQSVLYAAPDGAADAPGTAGSPCSLEAARNLVRKLNGAMTGDIVVNLKGGTYSLKSPFQLKEDATTHDSGTGGFNVIYQAAPGETPVLSGGITVTGWTLFDPAKNIYHAKVPAEINSRQLFVNHRLADRARGPLEPDGWTKTETGFTITDTSMQNWVNVSDIEVVSRSSWKHLRCGIASISGTTVTMKTPGWLVSSKTPKPGHPFNGAGVQEIRNVTWIENALELLATPGQWYLNSKTGDVYYIPLPGEDMAKASVVMPALEEVLDVSGSDFDHVIHNVQFRGITFKYATWLGPSGNMGYPDNQSGVLWCSNPPAVYKASANISFQYAHDCVFERNVVANMGGSGVDFGHGPQRNVIRGNCLYDISGNGIFLGEFDDYKEADATRQSVGNVIDNNYITRVGSEYEDCVGICAGYNRHLLVAHNDISECPYSGISVGWGWSDMGYGFQNDILNNHVQRCVLVLRDAAAIYTLGNQGDQEHLSAWKGNYVQDSNANGLYPDEYSGWMDITGNVVFRVKGKWAAPHIPHDIRIHDNYADKTNPPAKVTKASKADRHIKIENNIENENPDAPSAAAKAIMDAAGLQPEFADIKNQVVKPEFEPVSSGLKPGKHKKQ
jgi:hypothetical protein